MTRVCVAMWYDDAISDYADNNFLVNKEYCLENQLALVRSSRRFCTDRHPAWERLPLILNELPSYDWVVWVDADAHFYRGAPSVRTLIEENRDMDFIFSGDKPPRENINTGVFAVKNSGFSRSFIERWLNDEEAYLNNPFPGWWEQGVLIDMWDKNVLGIRQRSRVLDYGVLQHFYTADCPGSSPLVLHMAEQPHSDRVEHSKQYLGEN